METLSRPPPLDGEEGSSLQLPFLGNPYVNLAQTVEENSAPRRSLLASSLDKSLSIIDLRGDLWSGGILTNSRIEETATAILRSGKDEEVVKGILRKFTQKLARCRGFVHFRHFIFLKFSATSISRIKMMTLASGFRSPDPRAEE